MPLLILAALVAVPLLEIAVFIQVGGWIGLWPTLGLILLTAAIGTWELRAQGSVTLARARAELDAGRLPARELFDGLCLLVAGVLLLTPGFVTDTLGFLLFLPPLRDRLFGMLALRLRRRVAVRTARDDGTVIETEYFDLSQDPGQPANENARPHLRRWERP